MVCPPYTGICLFFVRWSSTFRGHRGASRKLPLCAMSLAQLEVWPWHRTFEATQETWNQFCCLPCDCQRRRKTDDRLWPIWPKVFFCGFIILSAKDVFFFKPTNILHASHFIIKNTCNLELFNLLQKKKCKQLQNPLVENILVHMLSVVHQLIFVLLVKSTTLWDMSFEFVIWLTVRMALFIRRLGGQPITQILIKL